jgi:uncharacterized protein YcgL (UPF0745 family)
MKVDIYQSKTNNSKYLSVKAGQSLDEITVPDTDYKTVSEIKLGIEISPEQPRISYDAKEAISAIETQGYYLHGVSTTFNEK